jgi:protoporphyrinogen oxidase
MANENETKKEDGLNNLISDTRKELKEYKIEHPEVLKPINEGSDVLDKILDKGLEALKIWSDTQTEIKKYQSDNQTKLENNKVDLLKESDKRNGALTLTLVISSLATIVILSSIDKFTTEAAVIVAVIITSLFSNRISKTINDISQTFKKTTKSEE